jgi:Fur family transcriptional regulator, ferric uptake regulator
MGSHGDDIDLALREQGLRVTQARRSVYGLLSGTGSPLSASQIDLELRRSGVVIDLVTIYRTLDTLERGTLVVRIDRQSDGWRYCIRSREHSHQITCSMCGNTSPLDVCDLARIEQALERRTGFTNISHSLQFHGTCPGCRETMK